MPSIAVRAVQTIADRHLAAFEDWLAAERHQLPLFIPIALGAGIAAWFAIAAPAGWIGAICLALAVAAVGLFLEGLGARLVIIGGILVAAGVGIAWWQAERVAAPVLDRTHFGVELVGTVAAVEHLPARDRTRLLVGQLAGFPPDMAVRLSFRAVPEDLGPGARIAVKATISPPPGPSVPGGYHFARRAWFEGIGGTGYALGDVTVLSPAPPPTGFSAWLANFRATLNRQLQQGVGGRAGGVAAALVTGDRGGIEPEVTEAMRDSGLAHLIAISGLHIAVVVGGTLWLVRRILTLWPWFALRFDARIVAAAFAALAGIAYTLIAGAGVPTVRACIAVLLVLIGLAAGREAISLRLVAVGATLILIWRPDYLLSPSFQLSFAAVTGIVALYQSTWGKRWSQSDREGGWPTRFLRGIIALILTGIVAELTIGPIALYHFNQMGLFGAGANLIAIPLTSFLIIPLLVLAVLLGGSVLVAPVYTALGATIDILIGLAEWVAGLPGAVAMAPAMPVSAFLLIVAGGLWICIWQGRRRWAGILPAAVGVAIAFVAPQPDLFVSPDGKHLAYLDGDSIAMLRPRAGDFITTMWSGAAGSDAVARLEDREDADCTPAACRLLLRHGPRRWDILATRSRDLIARPQFEAACRESDLVISDRYLPRWCRPRWLRLGRRELNRLGAVSIDLASGRVRSSAAEDGAHPWARGHEKNP
jgi:competence protein ComEC|tara:strand:+ start:57548 stop:59662 length:2115 start_codon:yes stop_codon:yes gene_type:complete